MVSSMLKKTQVVIKMDKEQNKDLNENLQNEEQQTKKDDFKRSEDFSKEFEAKIIDWTTFYRRNIHRFI